MKWKIMTYFSDYCYNPTAGGVSSIHEQTDRFWITGNKWKAWITPLKYDKADAAFLFLCVALEDSLWRNYVW